MKMLGKGKKIVSVAYKEKLLAELAHYEKRIEEALTKRKTCSIENESYDDELNPYKLKNQQSWFELKQQEASLSDWASMTLELAMLTIMQSEVNVMVTPPEVRKPIQEDGIWLEVAAECKIDLVSFTITFYAHKPHRRFAPTRYRNVVVTLVKSAHQKELAQSVLPKLNRPHLALQVLQSYAAAFRSRRTTLLELAETYADKLRMEAMPEGGYRVKFLNILQVDWTLENMWSPIVPFCHRMKFEVEYLPKDYIHTIGKLYKQFKDPSLETSERTDVLSKIFDTCMEAQGRAREIQESFESDPESASRLHERRTTIDQEPDVPNVDQSPKKPKGKENKAQNRKTSMAPPKAIPKKAKKINANKSNERKSVKRAIEDDASNDAKKSRIDEDSVNNSKAGLKGGKKGIDDNDGMEVASCKSDAQKGKTGREATGYVEVEVRSQDEEKDSGEVVKNAEKTNKVVIVAADDGKKKGDGKSVKSKSASDNSESSVSGKSNNKKDAGKMVVPDTKNGEISEASSTKRSKKGEENMHYDTNAKVKGSDGVLSEKSVALGASDNSKSSGGSKSGNKKRDAGKIIVDETKNGEISDASPTKRDKIGDENIHDDKNAKGKGSDGVISEKSVAIEAKTKAKKVANAKNDEVSPKHGTKLNEKNKNTVGDVAIPKKRNTKLDNQDVGNSKDKVPESNSSNTNKVNDKETASSASTKSVATKNKENEVNVSKNLKNKTGGVSKKGSNDVDKEAVGKTHEAEINKDETVKKVAPKAAITAKLKEVGKNVASKKTDKDNITEINNEKGKELKATSKATAKSADVKEKPTENTQKSGINDKNKELEQGLDKKKIINANIEQKSEPNTKTVVEKALKTKVSAQKSTKNAKKNATQSNLVNNINKNEPAKKLPDKTEVKTITKPPENAKKNLLKDNTNRGNTKTVKNIGVQNETKTNENTNLLNVTITKSKNIPPQKSQENQIKIADKLKTKIPMMKHKMTFSSLRDKVVNIGRISKVDKPRIAPKLPVFKQVVKNVPTRSSPRKLPSTFKPSSHGFSKK